MLRLHQVTAVICVPDETNCGNFLIPSKTSVCANDTAFISLGVIKCYLLGYLLVSAVSLHFRR